MEVTKEMARDFAEWFRGTLDLQESAQPCVYYFQGRIDFSPGSTTGGTAAPVYNGEASIIVDKQWWNEQYDSTLDEKADLMFEAIQEFVESVEEEEEEEQSGGKLIGSKEVAEILGWDIRRVSVYKGEKRMPSPITEVGGRPAWEKDQIMKFKEELKVKETIKNLKKYSFEQAKADYEEAKKRMNPRIHEVHMTISKDGKPFMKPYSDVSHAPLLASQQPWIEEDARGTFENAKRDLLHQLEVELAIVKEVK